MDTNNPIQVHDQTAADYDRLATEYGYCFADALSVRHVTGKPIKFAGTGEKVTGLEAFHPDRMASRILGMGDML